jgi:hypothetical protein
MSEDDLDRILASERSVEPSATLTSRIMSAVHREAAAPPAIAFPWRRLAPVLAVCGVALVTAVALFAWVLARTSAPLDMLVQAGVARGVRRLWSSGAPIAACALLAGVLSFQLARLRAPRTH